MPNGRRMTHRRPLHRLRKRPTFRNHIAARRREERVRKRLEAAREVESELTTPLPIIVGEHEVEERQHTLAEDLHDWVLGGQDGIVNVLGCILGVAVVTNSKYIIIVAGIAALAAESISMAAVAYTSVKASHAYYISQRENQLKAIRENPVLQREILIDVYERKGLSRQEASKIAVDLTRNEEVWLETLMQEHLHMYQPEESGPARSAAVVGFASLAGSFIPLVPFFFLSGMHAILTTCIVSMIVLFCAGAAGAKLTIGDWKARGLELAGIGMAAALVSFMIGFTAKLLIPGA
jgi:VIT1/CCC1 family predicted Fe2+/Mn2+ transporter